jgi:archaellum component FlaC
MTAIMKTRGERRDELKRLAARPNGIDKLYSILTRDFIPFAKLPIGTLMIEAILEHEYLEGGQRR